MVVHSNQFDFNQEREEETLRKKTKRMAVDENIVKVEASESGEISELDSESIQHINNVEVKVSPDLPKKTNTPETPTTTITTAAVSATMSDSASRYWRELYKYSYPRDYLSSGLYNLAWAQAVQNKPLNEACKQGEKLASPQAGDDENYGINNDSVAAKEDSKDDIGNDVGKSDFGVASVEDETEEGELEEGEIEMDCELIKVEEKSSINGRLSEIKLELEDEELERRVESIREVLDNVIETEAEKSFDFVCARVKSSLESLTQLVLHFWIPSKAELIQLSIAAVQCLNAVFNSMSHARKDQTKSAISRLLTFVMDLEPPLFSTEQMKEVETMMVSLKTKTGEKQELPVEGPVVHKAILTDSNSLAVVSCDIGSSVGALDKEKNNLLDMSGPVVSSNSMSKIGFDPLFDLHKVHDEDSLLSPTSRTVPHLPITQELPSNAMARSEPAASTIHHKVEKHSVQRYETAAVKAVSSYHQKFGRSSFRSVDRLPSPTPSEDGKRWQADDAGEEASSYFSDFSTRTTYSLVSPQHLVDSTINLSSSSVQGLVHSNSGLPGPESSPIVRPFAKSRDPRLKYMNSSSGTLDSNDCTLPAVTSSATRLERLGELNSNKHRTSELPDLDGPAVKKRRNGFETMANSDTIGPQNVNSSQIGTMPTDPMNWVSGVVSSRAVGIKPCVTTVGNSQSTVSTNTNDLKTLLKDIAVNPVAWMNVINGQRKLNELAKSLAESVKPGSALGELHLPDLAPPGSSLTGLKTAGLMQSLSPKAPMNLRDDSARMHVKPCHPHRPLQDHATHYVPEQSAKSEAPAAIMQGDRDVVNTQSLVNGTDTSSATSHTILLPEITQQFKTNLKNIADVISMSQSSMPPSALPQNSPLAVEASLDRVNVRSDEPEAHRPDLRPELVAACPGQPQNWGDVEHLFEKYDLQERATIQRERARRMEEQKKMFTARKLCLVLDLDHTLLNSAKFSEVDPAHDEILRKKEEQDREKSQRHLFRFSHMGLWTKLRPGIWNFLEKASKLYELHLYTMGNKLYATEMAKVLDPKGLLFAGRVISRGDDEDSIDGDDRVHKSKDLEGVLGMESSVLIIDDSVRVWPHNKLNLIVVERYIYFPCSRRQFGLSGPSLLEIDHDEKTEVGTLASSLAVIERIHQDFFSNKSLDDVDVRNILASEQRKILAGCRVVFSRVFPVGEANPHRHPLWKTAEQFGAVCTNQIDNQVTHVVAISRGTDKVNWAIAKGKHVVHPGWVEASALLYRRANEQEFALKP